MSKKPKLVVVEDENEPQAASQPDGRRQRSQRSREKILKAYWELMLNGDMNPSAATIAKHAGVGLRSVFRHFEDLDTLLRVVCSFRNKLRDWREGNEAAIKNHRREGNLS